MKTRSWKPSSDQAPATDTLDGGLSITEVLYVAENGEAPTQYSVFGALYLSVLFLRKMTPFSVSRMNGEELFSFDGTESTFNEDFAKALGSFEAFMLQERQEGRVSAELELNRALEEMGAGTSADEDSAPAMPPQSRTIARRR